LQSMLPEYLRKRYRRSNLVAMFLATLIVALIVLGVITAIASAQSTGGVQYQDPDALNRANVMVTYAAPFNGLPASYSVSVHKKGNWVRCEETKCPKVGRLVRTRDHKALLAKPTRTERIAGVIRNFSDYGSFNNFGRTDLSWSPLKRIRFAQKLGFEGELIRMKLLSTIVFFDDSSSKLTHPEICNDVDCPDTMVGPGYK
jgi:hypothetical protein